MPLRFASMRTRAHYSVAVAAAAIALGACGGGHSSSSNSPPATTSQNPPTTSAGSARARSGGVAAITRCSSAQLHLSFGGTQGATGHMEATFVLRNVSGSACTLRGYPGAQMYDPAGGALPTHVQRGGGFFPDTHLAVRRVSLAPGGHASFGLSFVTAREFAGGKPCPTAARLDSVPPNAYQPLRVSLTGAARPKFAPCGGQLVASPVH